jgi:hypothetical protein
MSLPELTKEARTMLEFIVSNTVTDGSTLMRYMRVSRAEDLVSPIRELQKNGLIEVGGAVTDDRLPFARFAVRPSAKEYLYSQLK